MGPDRPLLTYYDDATGERTELSAPELGSWSARVAALLRDGCGLTAGGDAAVLLPPHWQTAAVLLGAWSAGIAVSFRPWSTAGLTDPPAPAPDAVFVSRRRLDSWLEEVPAGRHRFVLGLEPGLRPLAEVPAGYRDFAAELVRQPDTAPAYPELRPGDAASPDGTTYAQWSELAHEIAASLGLRAGDRVLVDAGEHEQPLQWLLAPLVAGASIVLCANLDRDALDRRIAAEGVSRVL
ncbi:TIGR03089 family protein [Amorphoplanes nipponensis]|uniref:TIGR03089 family protein n=1 Tax=Actinoplanes nipponensis TaxID=135950 RepID=A0A919JJG6_9ACTN|nr:TIGR03089 family protein [Actinoplanes nipponensis]GIE50798.1 TIGR03089 family protein [Actinoplanes nipponensis]